MRGTGSRARLRPTDLGSGRLSRKHVMRKPTATTRTAISGLLLVLVLGLSLPAVVCASNGTLTGAGVGQDGLHGWVAGTVTWDQCSSPSQCYWDASVIVKPASEPCSVQDLHEATPLERGVALSSVYFVSNSGGWLENGTVKIGGIGFPAVVGQQACLEAYYTPYPGSEQRQDVVLASRPFVAEQHAVPTPVATPTPPGPAVGTAPAGTLPTAPAGTLPGPKITPTRAQRFTNALRLCRRRSIAGIRGEPAKGERMRSTGLLGMLGTERCARNGLIVPTPISSTQRRLRCPRKRRQTRSASPRRDRGEEREAQRAADLLGGVEQPRGQPGSRWEPRRWWRRS